MPLVGKIAIATFVIITALVAWWSSLLRQKLQGRQPCQQWFAVLAGMLAAASVFGSWTGIYGLGNAEPGWSGAVFGVFAGLVWGGLFSFVSARILWKAFDSPIRDDSAEYEQTMNTDVGVLVSRAIGRVLSFRPTPQFAGTGMLPWTIFLAAMLLPALWACVFCQLTWMTEGAPGVDPVMPIDN